MVYINLSKLILLIKSVKECPIVIPKRCLLLFEQYSTFKKTSEDKVSVEVPVELEKLIEIDVDMETDSRKKQIIFHLIDVYTNSDFSSPNQSTDIYIVSPLEKCMKCSGNLIFTRPGRRLGKAATVYTLKGPRTAKTYIKHCEKCLCAVFNCYTEWSENGTVMRRYNEFKTICSYFCCTTESFFEVGLLEDLEESVFTCNSRFVRWVEKYNRMHLKNYDNQSIERFKLNRQRILPCWLLYSIHKRITVNFPVLRNSDRSLDIEAICCFLYPSLKKFVDQKWLNHQCERCQSRIVVMDSNAKLYRTVYARAR